LRDGNRSLTDDQLERLRRGLERAVARQCPRWLAERREDIVQNALIRVVEAWRKAERSQDPSHSYLVKAAFTAIAGEIRTLRKERSTSLDAVPEAHAAGGGDPTPESRMQGRELAAAIRSCLAALGAPRRVAVALALAGYGRERIAQLLGVEVKKVDNDRHRGLKDLQRCLEEKGFTP
jgi:RNA polymerase sigma factor (sigma-70 family)